MGQIVFANAFFTGSVGVLLYRVTIQRQDFLYTWGPRCNHTTWRIQYNYTLLGNLQPYFDLYDFLRNKLSINY